MSAIRNEQRSIGDLFSDLSEEASRLVHQEIELAKTEMSQKASATAKSSSLVVAGGLVSWLGLQGLVASAIVGLGSLIGYGWSALTVGGLILLAGLIVTFSGIGRLKRTRLAPDQTVAQIKETKAWLKREM